MTYTYQRSQIHQTTQSKYKTPDSGRERLRAGVSGGKSERASADRCEPVRYVQSGTTWRRQARDPDPLRPPTSARQQEATPGLRPMSPRQASRATQEDLLVSPLSPHRRPAGPTSRPAALARPQRQTPMSSADDIPVFDRNKVSLDFPGNLFGPSVSLLIKTTKIIGDVIQNSAVRYQSFLRLFQPLFRGPFEIKGLDPPTTTTTTTTPAPADNEVRRRRRA